MKRNHRQRGVLEYRVMQIELLLIVERINMLNQMTYHTLQETRRPPLQHLRNAQLHRCLRIFLRVVALEHPDALTEPGDEFEIIGGTCRQKDKLLPQTASHSVTSNQRLRGMHMRGN